MCAKKPGNPMNEKSIGFQIHRLMTELYPLCRSITGDGFRKSMEILRRHVPLEIREVPSGTRVFDWTVPKEWNIRDAYIKNPKGKKIVDFRKSNLHVVSYSIPVKTCLSLKDLKEHLFTLPAHPDWVPYKTSYYEENWGFCLSHRQFLALEEGDYEVVIDSSLEEGFLTYGELLLPGEKEEEVLISAHACHPSLANDNLSGVGLATILAKHLGTVGSRFSYRFLFIPGTIGAITWLSLNEEKVKKIKAGLVVSGVGDKGEIAYKKSRRGNAEIDRAAAHVLGHSGQPYRLLDFHPFGYDERQYCSPGFNLPVGRISRTPYREYPEYHTSADNLEFVTPDSLTESYEKIRAILNVLEGNRNYLSQNQKCEPQLGKRGLYASSGAEELALLWVLNLSDGGNSLLDIAERSGLTFGAVQEAAQTLVKAGLLVAMSEHPAVDRRP
jgi:aminopeptidase-like protein